jgi:formate hydrogenlyase subunit 6/NADH:ubiquinone oxidoreductase subunit I
MKNLFVEKPVPLEEACTLCYQCRHICPADAISDAGGGKKVPQFDYRRCIRCFCCQEICPEGAITIRQGKMQWVLRRR